MRWSKLKPGERSRKFVREVGSIVLGVLIALALGEVADGMRWQQRAKATNRALDEERARVAGVMSERVMVQPCLTRRLRELEVIVRDARRSAVLPYIGEIGRPPIRPVETAAWDEALGSGVLLHFERERRIEVSSSYPQAALFPQGVSEEQSLWATLHILEAAPGPVSSDLIAEAATTIAQLRYLIFMNGLRASQLLEDIARSGVSPSYTTILSREGTRDEVARALRARSICQPLSVGRPN